MRVDLSKVITRLNGQVVEDAEAPKNAAGKYPPLTLASAVVTALSVDFGGRDVTADGKTADGKEKYRRIKLALKIDAAPDHIAEISDDDADRIRHVVGLAWPPFVVGPVYDALEATATPAHVAS